MATNLPSIGCGYDLPPPLHFSPQTQTATVANAHKGLDYCSVKLNFALWLTFRICAKRRRIVGAVSKHARCLSQMWAYLEIAPTMSSDGKTKKVKNST
jgi:hypothetical protein